MEFKDNESIYLQIAGYVGQNILLRKWNAEQKLLSVRDMAVELQVNLNTVMRAYELLESIGVIYNKRGIGFFVAADGYDKMKAYRKQRFIQHDLPSLFDNLYLLDITQEELFEWYEEFMNRNYPSTQANDNEKE